MRKFLKNRKADGGTPIGTMIAFIIFIMMGLILAVALLVGAGLQTNALCALSGQCSFKADQIAVNLHDHPFLGEKDIIVIEATLTRTPQEVWKAVKDGEHFDAMAAGDVNGDGVDEIIMGGENPDSIRVIYPPDPYTVVDNVGKDIHPAMAAGDFDADGKDEIAVVVHDHPFGGAKDHIYVYDAVSRYNINPPPIVLRTFDGEHIVAIAAGNLIGEAVGVNKKDEIAVGTDRGKIYILGDIDFGASTKAYQYYTINAYSDFYPNMLVTGNFTGKNVDGIAYITNSDDRLWVIDWPWSNAREVHDYNCNMNGLAAGDFNGDQKDDTLAICDDDDTGWLITEMGKPTPEAKKVIDFDKHVLPIVAGKFAG